MSEYVDIDKPINYMISFTYNGERYDQECEVTIREILETCGVSVMEGDVVRCKECKFHENCNSEIEMYGFNHTAVAPMPIEWCSLGQLERKE